VGITKELEALGPMDTSLALDSHDLDILNSVLKAIATDRSNMSLSDLHKIGSQLIRLYSGGAKTEAALITAYNERQSRSYPASG